MGRPQVSFLKRQREQAKRERQQMKIERRAQRASEPQSDVVEGAEVEESAAPAPDGLETDASKEA